MFRHAQDNVSTDEAGSMSSEADDASDDASGMRSAPRDAFDEVTGTRSSMHSVAREAFEETGSSTRPRPPTRSRLPAGQTAESLPDLPPHLQIRKVLGQGGTAVVYEAMHTRLHVRVAVKVLAATGPHEAEGRERLLREAEHYAHLTDPRFPRVYDVDELPDGTPYVVMEFIEGKTLAEALMYGPLELELVYMIAREILEALIELHQGGIVHRDIKPSNIILEGAPGQDMRVRLVDFGIAKSVLTDPTDQQLTQQGTMLGTPHYMAPEQITAQELDARVDIYAIGVVLYELLSGRMPFDAPTVGEVIAAALRDTPRPLTTLRPDLPEAFERLVAKAMARDREQRFASAHEMLCALHAARVRIDEPALLSTTPQAEVRRRDPEHVLLIVPEDDFEDEHPTSIYESSVLSEVEQAEAGSMHDQVQLPSVDDREADVLLRKIRRGPAYKLIRVATVAGLGCALFWPSRIDPSPNGEVSSPPERTPSSVTEGPATSAAEQPATAAPLPAPTLWPEPTSPSQTPLLPPATLPTSAPLDATPSHPATEPVVQELRAPERDMAPSSKRARRYKRTAAPEPKMMAPHTLQVQDVETRQAPRELEMRSPSTDRFDSQKSTDPDLNIPSNPYL